MTPGNQNESAAETVKRKAKTIIDSSSEVRITWTKTLLLLGAVVVAWNVGNHVWHRKTGDPWFGVDVKAVQAQAAPTQEPTQEPTPEPTQNAHVEVGTTIEYVEVVVTATPSPVPPTPEVVYYEIPVEVTRLVEVAATPLPTPTIVPLAPGTIEICVRVEGAREVYIGGGGVVSGACSTYHFGVGQTSIAVQVNR